MGMNVYHAIATMAELGMALSVAALVRIVPELPAKDSAAREETRAAMQNIGRGGRVQRFFFDIVCWFVDKPLLLPLLAFLVDFGVLLSMSYCDQKDSCLPKALSYLTVPLDYFPAVLLAISTLVLLGMMVYAYIANKHADDEKQKISLEG